MKTKLITVVCPSCGCRVNEYYTKDSNLSKTVKADEMCMNCEWEYNYLK